MSWRKHFTPVDNSGLPLNVQRKTSMSAGAGAAASRYASWLPEVYAGSPNRLMRYIQYNQMDQDLEINAALDTIAEFGTQEDEHNGLPFVFEYENTPSDTESKILNKTLRQWCNLNNLHKRAFRIFRNTVKYGDQFFIRDPETYELFWVDPANVEKVIVNESEGKKIETYFIKDLEQNLQELTASSVAALHNRPYGSGQGLTGVMSPVATSTSNYLTGAIDGVNQGIPVEAKHVVHISLTEGMDGAWPFGVSILEPIFKVFKQKELLEDSILIYRIHRAPERRIFFIDVGNMPPHKAKQYLEQVKYEVQQKRVPNKRGDGSSVTDASYNPMCLDLSTKIPLLDGRVLTLSELITEYQSGKENWVYSTDPATGAILPGNITWAGITRTNAKTIKITFDNNETLICTPDHKIPVLGKGFVEAKDLSEHDPLISFEIRERSLSGDPKRSYTQVYDHEINNWVFTHRMVAEFFRKLGKHQTFIFNEDYASAEKNTVHHKDYNRYNNEPGNLQWMNFKDHVLYHSLVKQEFWKNISTEESDRIKAKICESLKEYREQNPKKFLERYKNRDTSCIAQMKADKPEKYSAWRQSQGLGRSRYLANNPGEKSKLIQMGKNVLSSARAQNQNLIFTVPMLTRLVEIVKNNNTDRLKTIEMVNLDSHFMSLMQSANPVLEKSTKNVDTRKFTNSKLKIMYKTYGYKNWKDFKKKTQFYNHRIKKIETVENRDVGTITVDFQERWHSHHTFAIAAGIFVKNSMLEDYFFAQTADGRGSKVDTLPGGENLGQIDDLRYFNNKLLRGLRIPSSYLPTGPEDGSSIYNDGKVGVAYIQEFRFAKYVERLQKQIEEHLDFEFKMFLKHRGIEIDNGEFRIRFTPPMSFSSYRDIQLESERASLYNLISGVTYMSNRFKLKKYLGLTDDEIKENESLWREENKYEQLNNNNGTADIALRDIGVRPELENNVNTEMAPDLGGIALPSGEAGAETGLATSGETPSLAGEV
jgi:hypothetical protein